MSGTSSWGISYSLIGCGMAPELKVVAPETLVRDAEEGIFPVKTKDVCVCVCVCV